jgi:type I restriction-modification system DNA methylase subunit
MEALERYLESVGRQYNTGIAREHAYRPYLQALFETIDPTVLVTNEPARVACGAPDFILTKNSIPVGYIEAKDIGKVLDSKDFAEQVTRYRSSLSNLILTDYLDFWIYRDGDRLTTIRIAKLENGRIRPMPEHFEDFIRLAKDFTTHLGQTITSAQKLSEMMAGKARLLASVIDNALTADESMESDSTLRDQMAAFKSILIHDIQPRQFADIYAQTIAYGMFAARLNDPSLEDFSRQEAAELIPKSNPFLRHLFGYIAGPNLDERITWIVDALAQIFRATDVASLLKNFGKPTQKTDPVIHFYETFLSAYDPTLRKSRGVWYTPEPVVHFIVKSVDHLLATRFGLSNGLADTSTTTIKEQTQVRDRRSRYGYKTADKEVHKVQILDPAAGTGTFLAEIVKQIFQTFKGKEGIWSSYVEEHLIPRLHGFEILMASYAMAHLKLEMLLSETGYIPAHTQRLRIFLTNSLEEHHPDTGTLFASWLSREASEANWIKRDTPVMVVLGNPPYSGISSNMGEWISSLIEDYKYVDGTHFGERKHWLHDDYVKFIRYGQHFIERNGEGVLAYINNHNFIDNPTFRGMRWTLLKTFDEIFLFDLHGDTKKAEMKPANVPIDENVFDIQQGVSINIFVRFRARTSKKLATVKYYSFWGSRSEKYEKLWDTNITDIPWVDVDPVPPNYFFAPNDYSTEEWYLKGFSVADLFILYTMGFASAKDRLTVAFDEASLWETVTDFFELDEASLRSKYNLRKDSRDWTVKTAIRDIRNNYDRAFIRPVCYRPFDERVTYYTGNSRGFFASPQKKVMDQLSRDDNFAFCSCRMNRDLRHTYWVCESIVSKSVISSLDNAYVFPLYVYTEIAQLEAPSMTGTRTPNFNRDVVEQISADLGLRFVEEPSDEAGTYSPFDVVDYLYAVLHRPAYREKYKQFLKVDFPRVPFPKDQSLFWQYVNLGRELRQVHMGLRDCSQGSGVSYPVDGSIEVRSARFEGAAYLSTILSFSRASKSRSGRLRSVDTPQLKNGLRIERVAPLDLGTLFTTPHLSEA